MGGLYKCFAKDGTLVRSRTDRWSDGPDGQVGQRRPNTPHSTFFLVKSSQLTKNGTKANRSGPDARRPRSKGHHLLQQVRNRTDGPDGQVGQRPPNMLHYSLLISLGQKLTIDHGCLQSQSQWPRCQKAQKQGPPSAPTGPEPHGWSGWPSWPKSSSKVSALKL